MDLFKKKTNNDSEDKGNIKVKNKKSIFSAFGNGKKKSDKVFEKNKAFYKLSEEERSEYINQQFEKLKLIITALILILMSGSYFYFNYSLKMDRQDLIEENDDLQAEVKRAKSKSDFKSEKKKLGLEDNPVDIINEVNKYQEGIIGIFDVRDRIYETLEIIETIFPSDKQMVKTINGIKRKSRSVYEISMGIPVVEGRKGQSTINETFEKAILLYRILARNYDLLSIVKGKEYLSGKRLEAYEKSNPVNDDSKDLYYFKIKKFDNVSFQKSKNQFSITFSIEILGDSNWKKGKRLGNLKTKK